MISEKHLAEWVTGSGVSEEIASYNIETLEDPREIDQRLQRNSDRRWKHWEHGAGWWVSGVDPKTGESTLNGGQFKPDSPVKVGTKADGSDKVQKYFSVLDAPASALFLAMPNNHDYWRTILSNTSQPVFVTEGAKKAGVLLTHGYPCISLSGVTNGQLKGRLKADLKQFCVLGRTIVFAFDMDAYSKLNVWLALDALAKLMAAEGAVIKIAKWDEEHKGIDDLAVAMGDRAKDAIEQSIDDAITWKEFQSLKPERTVDAQKLPKGFEHLSFEDMISNYTSDDHVYRSLFRGTAHNAPADEREWITVNAAFYRWNGIYWKNVPDDEIEQIVARKLQAAWKPYTSRSGEILDVSFPFATNGKIESAIAYCQKMLAIPERWRNNRHLLCFDNCTVNLVTGERLPHDKAHYLTSAIPADYSPNSECPKPFYEFVRSAFGENLLEVIQATTSMLIDPTAPYGRAPHLLGPSGSGKGTIISLWTDILGYDHVRPCDNPADLTNPERRYQLLTGTRMIVFSDIGGHIANPRGMYSVTDNEPQSMRPLYGKRAYTVRPDARVVMASVNPLSVENAGDGWHRRYYPLPLKHRVGDMDPFLKQRLAECKAEIISWALSMDRTRRQWILDNLSSYEEIEIARSETSLAGDSVRSFIDFCLRPCDDGECAPVQVHQIYGWYEAYCQSFGSNKMSLPKLLNRLKMDLPAHHQERKRGKADGSGKPAPMIPAHFFNLRPFNPSTFVSFTSDSAVESNRVYQCIKHNCQPGGLFEFAQHQQQILLSLPTTPSHDPGDRYAQFAKPLDQGTFKPSDFAPILDETQVQQEIQPTKAENPDFCPDLNSSQQQQASQGFRSGRSGQLDSNDTANACDSDHKNLRSRSHENSDEIIKVEKAPRSGDLPDLESENLDAARAEFRSGHMAPNPVQEDSALIFGEGGEQNGAMAGNELDQGNGLHSDQGKLNEITDSLNLAVENGVMVDRELTAPEQMGLLSFTYMLAQCQTIDDINDLEARYPSNIISLSYERLDPAEAMRIDQIKNDMEVAIGE